MRLKLSKLQNNNKEARKLRSKRLPKGLKDIEEVLHYQGLSYILKLICSDLISKPHDKPVAKNFKIEKTQALIARLLVLLANGTKRCSGLCQGIRHILSFKDSLPQALQKFLIVVCSNSLVKKPVNGLCYGFISINKLEK